MEHTQQPSRDMPASNDVSINLVLQTSLYYVIYSFIAQVVAKNIDCLIIYLCINANNVNTNCYVSL